MNSHDHAVVLNVLQRAVSQNPAILKQAEAELKELEISSGFYIVLKDVIRNQSIDVNVRLLALLYFKNGVEKYWRPGAPNAIAEHQKTEIRQGLLDCLNEPVKLIASHLAILISRIARFDCPKAWPELIPFLLEATKRDDLIVQNRSLMVLHQVVKNLSSKRLPINRLIFLELSSFAYSHLLGVWNTHFQIFTNEIQENRDGSGYLENVRILLKILGTFTVQGFRKPHENPEVNTFIKLLFERAKLLLNYRKSSQCNEELTSKTIVRSFSILLNLLDTHPLSFINYIPDTLEFAILCAFTAEGDAYSFDRLLIQCFNLIKNIVSCSEYSCRSDDFKKAYELKQSCLDANTLAIICKKLVTHYLLLTPQELELWNSNPEVFALDEAGDLSKYSLRPSIESLFAALFDEYGTMLSPIVLDLVRENSSLVSPDDFQAILYKDAVYNAVGIVANELYNYVDFDSWFLNTLVKELEVPDSNYRIIRRRVAWLVGCWIGVKFSSDMYPMVYSAMLPLIKSETDMVVRLTAASTIRLTLNCFEFDISGFLDYLEPMFFALFTLLKEAQECDTKMRVLHVLCFVVERVENKIEPYYNNLAQYLPLLWHESEPHNMLRCAVVNTLVQLFKALGKINENEDVYNFTLSVISMSTNVNDPCHVYLLEDGLDLWAAVVENSPAPTPGVIMLFKNMPELLITNADHLRICLLITQMYALLSPECVFQVYGESLIHSFIDILSDMNNEGEYMLMCVLELFLKVNTASSNLIKPLLPRIFEFVYEGKLNSSALTSVYLSIISRIMMESQGVFVEVIRKVSSSVGENEDEVFRRIAEVWLEKMPFVSQIGRKKLAALALCSLITTDPSFVFDKFCGILLAVTDVLNDVTSVGDDGVRFDCLVETENSIFDDVGEETEHDLREKQISLKDPVHRIVLEDYFRAKLDELRNLLPPYQFEQLVQTVDAETLKQAREFVSI